MTFLAVKDVHTLSRSDFYRLGFYDDKGSSETYPYSLDFINHQDFEQTYCYDRFWDPKQFADANEQPLYGAGTEMNTRYVLTGYSFLCVGDSDNWFFNNIIQDHYQKHYFILALFVNLQRASLLAFQKRLTALVASENNTSHYGHEFRERVFKLYQDLLAFNYLYWFSEISPQLQGQELYSM